jgi:heptosyltransferase I
LFKVLIVKLSSLGDVVHTLPVVHDIQAVVPGAQIDWVVERGFAPLLARCTGITRVIPCELRQWRKQPFSATTRKAWQGFKAELQQAPYDAVIDLQGLSKSALVAWLARTSAQGVRYAMANQTDGSGYEAPTRWVADRAIALPPHIHAVDRGRLLCAAALGYQVQGAPQSVFNAHHKTTHTKHKPIVALVHGTSRADKKWPIAHWVALGQRLNQCGYQVALAQGSASELAESEQIAAQLNDAFVWPRMALDKVVDALAECAGVVGVDSGLSHIAVALNLPHVQIYNFDTAWRTGPQHSERQRAVFASPYPEVERIWQAWLAVLSPENT